MWMVIFGFTKPLMACTSYRGRKFAGHMTSFFDHRVKSPQAPQLTKGGPADSRVEATHFGGTHVDRPAGESLKFLAAIASHHSVSLD